MTRRTLIYLLCAVFICTSACSRIEQPTGSVTLSFQAGDPATRAESLGDGNAADGGGIYCAYEGSEVKPDLLIFIADENGSIIKSYDGWDNTADDGTLIEQNYGSSQHSATRLTVSFQFSQTGTFYVYGIANTRGAGDNYNLVIPALSSISTVSDLTDKILTLSNDKTPNVGDRMPLSATGTLNVYKNNNKYNGQVKLEMLRCFGKVQFYFKNLMGSALTLYRPYVKIYDMNAKEGYLFEAAPDDFVVPATGNNYRNYTYTGSNSNPTTIASGGTLSLFPTPPLFFPSIAPLKNIPSTGNRYLCDISFRVPKPGVTYNKDNADTYELKEFKNLPIHDILSQDIQALGRNQFLKIETTISGTQISFNFIVTDWTERSEEVFFH